MEVVVVDVQVEEEIDGGVEMGATRLQDLRLRGRHIARCGIGRRLPSGCSYRPLSSCATPALLQHSNSTTPHSHTPSTHCMHPKSIPTPYSPSCWRALPTLASCPN